ncbi:glycosyltransferase [Microbacterium memoriense]|uniref:4,4'-diaponeurosporenoate glycosyltransferase n=1 Tax=Microbacterium memoriense TaxID=2978350 RepID=A0ABT2PDV9_9MICO|nr:glycosyltransferase [Microbacterium memoriense]MCT9002620.1 glycosyltransferase [Microbacterium memoriense]
MSMGNRGILAVAATLSRRVRGGAHASIVDAYPADGTFIDHPASRVHGEAPCVDARGGVVIPAHDEAAVIGRTLEGLAPLVRAGVEVIVVCNGCSDDTATIARSFPGVNVLETPIGSKTHAMNLADEVATSWPRLYLDADIDIAPEAVCAVFDALAEPGVVAARARYVYDISSASWPVRSYYRARSRVPAPERRLWGAGGYATGAVGHARFGAFANVTADDSWFDEQFAEEEKRIVATEPMRVRTPRNADALLAVLTRQRRGYVEIGVSAETGTRGRGLLQSVRGIRDLADVGWYVLFTLEARRRAARTVRAGGQQWERDASTRIAADATL